MSYARVEEYVAATLHEPLSIRDWPIATRLPAFLRSQYRFGEGDLRGVPTLWLLSAGELTPGVLRKHRTALEAYWRGQTVTVFERISAYARQRMIQKGLPFVVPGKQMYLPGLAIDLRERVAAPHQERARLRPAAQVVLIHALLHPATQAATATRLAESLGYSAMTMSRALTELEVGGLMAATRAGRERLFSLADSPSAVWDAAQSVLASPVKRRLWIAKAPATKRAGHAAGLTALAGYSSLAAPRVPIVAMTAGDLRQLEQEDDGLAEVPFAEDAEREIEVWAYDLRLLSDGPAVDRLSLCLSLRDDPDERTSAALHEMMRGIKW